MGHFVRIACTCVALALASCGSASGDRPEDAGSPDLRPDVPAPLDGPSTRDAPGPTPVDARVPPSGVAIPISLPGCDGIGPGTEDCHARMGWDSARCGGGPCARLVVYWSGGEQSCVDGRYDMLLARYVEAGFVAACAQPFTTSDEAGRYPYADEFERMTHLIDRIRAEAGGAWDGTHLLIAGVSHGATAPAAAIASRRALRDHAATWTGSTHTAVVLFDGISNPATLEEWTGSQIGCAELHARFVGRYADSAPLLHSCRNGACYCATRDAAWERDTTVIGATYPPSPYACDAFAGLEGSSVLWRYISCGSTAPPCGMPGDIVPNEQQRLAHDALAACPGAITSYQDLPDCPHGLCGGWERCGGADAVAWLEANGW